MSEGKELSDRACTACGCLCDDVVVTIESDEIACHESLCAMGEQWLQAGLSTPEHELDGSAASLDEVVMEGASILRDATAPLVYGLQGLDVDGVRAAAELADELGALVVPELSALDRASTAALQTVGMSTATFGEIRYRADTIVFWRADPLSKQPRFWERFVEAPGSAILDGRKGREIWVFDDQKTDTAALADHHVSLPPNYDLPVVWQLRGLIEGVPVGQPAQGLHDEALGRLAKRLQESRYSAVVLGEGIAETRDSRQVVEGLVRLVRTLNTNSRSVVVPLHRAGGLPAMQWASGTAGPVDFASGAPRAVPGSPPDLETLVHGEVDAAVLVGEGSAERLTDTQREALAETPTIVVGGAAAWPALKPNVRLGTLTPGVTAKGQAFRGDGLALPLRPMLQGSGVTPAQALRLLGEAVAR